MSLPRFWITTRLENIVLDTQPGFAQQPKQEKIGVPQLRTNNVSTEGTLDLSEIKYVEANEVMIEKYGVQKGDIIFNNTNSPDLVGKTAFFDLEEVSYVISNHMTRIRVDAELVDPEYLARYLHYLWKSGATKSWAKQWVSQAAIDQPSLLNFDVILPPLLEQRRIANILHQANTLRQWRREAKEKLNSLLVQLFNKMFGDFSRQIDYPIQSLSSVADVVSGVAKGRRLPRSVTVPYLRVANVQAGYLDLKDIKNIEALPEEVELLALKRGDVLLTEGGDFDKLGRGALLDTDLPPNCIHQNHVFRVRVNNKSLHPIYFSTCLQTAYARAYFLRASKRTTNLASINLSQLKALPVPLPPTQLQEQFAELAEAYRLVEQEQNTSAGKLETLFQSIIALSFTGKLTATWRGKREEELQRAAVERDKKLGLRGEKPRLIDYEMGRVTPEEAEQFRRIIQPLTNGAIQAVANAYQPILQAFSQNLFKQAVFTNFADEVMKGLPDFTSTFREVVASSTTELNQVTRRSLIDVSSMLEAVTAPLNEAIRQSTENFYLSLANQLSQIALTPPPQPNRAIHESLDPITSDVLRMAQYASVYFRAEELAEDGISSVQIEASLHLLEALGFVRQVEVDGRLVYRLLDEKAEVASKPDGLDI